MESGKQLFWPGCNTTILHPRQQGICTSELCAVNRPCRLNHQRSGQLSFKQEYMPTRNPAGKRIVKMLPTPRSRSPPKAILARSANQNRLAPTSLSALSSIQAELTDHHGIVSSDRYSCRQTSWHRAARQDCTCSQTTDHVSPDKKYRATRQRIRRISNEFRCLPAR